MTNVWDTLMKETAEKSKMKQPDWSKAPKNAEYWNENDGLFYRVDDYGDIMVLNENLSCWSPSEFEVKDIVRARTSFYSRPRTTEKPEMNQPDWSKAPEGATHYDLKHGDWYRMLHPGSGIYYWSFKAEVWIEFVIDKSVFLSLSDIIEKPEMTDDLWIEWNGGECPVEEGTLVDVKYRNGEVNTAVPALRCLRDRRGATDWEHYSNECQTEIIAYRLSRVTATEITNGELTDGTKIRMLTKHDPTPVADLTMDAPGYELLADVLMKAYLQASDGKGRDRHAGDDEKPFSEQPIMTIQQMVGPGFTLGQAIKKIEESQRMDLDAACAELLGVVIYIAAAIGHLEKQMKG